MFNRKNLKVLENENEIEIFKKFSIRLFLKMGLAAWVVFFIGYLDFLFVSWLLDGEDFNWLDFSFLNWFLEGLKFNWTILIFDIILFTVFFITVFLWLGRAINKTAKADAIKLNFKEERLEYKDNKFKFQEIEKILINQYSKVRFEGKTKEIFLVSEENKIQIPTYNKEEIEIITQILKKNTNIKIQFSELEGEIQNTALINNIKLQITKKDNKTIIDIKFDLSGFLKHLSYYIFLILGGFTLFSLVFTFIDNLLFSTPFEDIFAFRLFLIADVGGIIVTGAFFMYFYYTLGKLDPYDTLVLRNQKGIIEINEYQYKIAHNAKIIFVEKELDTKGIFLERKVDGHVVQDAIIRQNGEKIPLPFIYDESVLKELVQIVSEKLKIEIG